MPDQFTVPQFIDAEDRILGPITVRQFLILLVAFLLVALFWKLFSFILFLLLSIPVLMLGGILAFVRINGMPFHFFVLNILQTLRKPHVRVWDKTLLDGELRLFLETDTHEAPPPLVRKASPHGSHLDELALVVNTGGAYRPEETHS